jgi:hypothetical protein
VRDLSYLLQPPGQATTTDAPAEVLWDALLALRPAGLDARFLRGTRMETLDGALAEFSAALQFPPYVSATLDGLDECLNDLEWLPAGPLVLVFLAAERVLAQATATDQEALARILTATVRAWHDGENGPPRTLHVIHQSLP